MRILLIEDNERLANEVCKGLEREGFAVDGFSTVEDGEAAKMSAPYDAAILDLGLPDGDGLDLLKGWRDRSDNTPVLILTARDGVEDKVRGLNAGGDDYLLKPFEMAELVARIRALLRRPGGALGSVLVAGNLAFDTSAREVLVDGSPISVSRREMGVLEQLLRRKDRVVAKSVLEEKLYGFDEEVTSNSVEANVSRLRKRLSSAGATVTVHTLRGVGYLLSEEEVLSA